MFMERDALFIRSAALACRSMPFAAADFRYLLAKGISIAMNTTAFGLIVAIPCMGAQMFMQAVTKKILDEIDQYSVKLENLLVSRIRSGGGGGGQL